MKLLLDDAPTKYDIYPKIYSEGDTGGGLVSSAGGTLIETEGRIDQLEVKDYFSPGINMMASQEETTKSGIEETH